MQNKLLKNHNKILKTQKINKTLFITLITLKSQKNHNIQPSKLNYTLKSSHTNTTHITNKLKKHN